MKRWIKGRSAATDTGTQDDRATSPAASPANGRRWRIRLLPVLLITLGILVMGYLVSTKPRPETKALTEKAWTIRVQEAAHKTHQPVLSVFGEITAGQEIQLRSLVAGDVVDVGPNFRNGGVVSKDDLLLVIDNFDYQAAVEELTARVAETAASKQSEESSLIRDREMLDVRRRELKRAERLQKRGNVSEASLDQARLALSQQQLTVSRRAASVKTQTARLTQNQVALRRAKRDLQRTKLVAPFDGFVSGVAAQVGKRLSLSDQVGVLVASHALEARGHLPANVYGRLLADGGLEGRPAQIRWQVGESDLIYDAKVGRITSQIDAASGGILFYAVLENSDSSIAVRPGAFVEIRLPDRKYTNAVRISANAVHDNDHVFVVTDQNRLDRRPVTVLARTGNDVILSGEIADGDRIVLTRFTQIAQDVLVRVLGDETKAPVPDKPAAPKVAETQEG